MQKVNAIEGGASVGLNETTDDALRIIVVYTLTKRALTAQAGIGLLSLLCNNKALVTVAGAAPELYE